MLVGFKCCYPLRSRAWQAGQRELCIQKAASVLQRMAGITPPPRPALPAGTARRIFLTRESGAHVGRRIYSTQGAAREIPALSKVPSPAAGPQGGRDGAAGLPSAHGSLEKPPPASEPRRGSGAAARSMSTRLLISTVKRSRELNYRAGTVPSGFRCQQHLSGAVLPHRTEPAASATFAHIRSLGSAGPWLELWEELQSLRLTKVRTQNKEDSRCCLQKPFSLPAAACTGLWRCYCSPPIGAGPPTSDPHGRSPVPSAAVEAKIRAQAAAFARAEAAAAAGEAASETAITWSRVLGWPGDALAHFLSPDQCPFFGGTSPSKMPVKPTTDPLSRLGVGCWKALTEVSIFSRCLLPLYPPCSFSGCASRIGPTPKASLPEDAGTAAP